MSEKCARLHKYGERKKFAGGKSFSFHGRL